MNREKKLIKNTGIYAVGNIGSKVLTYFMVLIYSYYISPDEMGYYDLILTSVSMLQPVIIFQLNEGVYRFIVENTNKNTPAIIGTGAKYLFVTTCFFELILMGGELFF